jgi:hypothetical protein
MKKLMPLAASIILILVAGVFASAGLMAQFTDTEKSSGNAFTAGTLDLKVGGKDDPQVANITLGNIAPGWSGEYRWTLKNAGTLDGKLWIEVVNIVNKENGLEEPEVGAPGEDGTEHGELEQCLKVTIFVYDRVEKGDTYWGFAGHPFSELEAGGWSANTLKNIPEPYGLLKASEDDEYVKMVLTLPTDVGNCVQGDSVSFDIVFHLDQAP